MKSLFKILPILPLIFIMAVSKTYSQNDSTKNIIGKKNEIGVNIGPVILVTLGGTPYPQPLGLTYKRVSNKWALRFNYTFKPFDNSWFFNTERTTIISDTQVIDITSRRSRSHILRVGCEYRHKFKSGWYLVSGLDLSGQYTDASRQINQAIYKIDSIINYGTAEASYQTTLLSHSNLLDEKTYTSQIGLGLTIGAMLPAGKRWWFLAQFRADAFFGPTRTIIRDKVAGNTTSTSASTFDFRAGPAVSELSLFFRF